MTVIGLTGSFGTGKTFVASIFKSLGTKVIDADKIVHRLQKKGTSVYKEIVGTFGMSILDDPGNIDRKKLAAVVFGNGEKLKRLNSIVHPKVIKIIKDEVELASSKGVVVIDAPLLIEANLTSLVNKLIVVKCSRENQIERCMKKFKIGKEEVEKRIGSQVSLEEKLKMADFVVDNDGTRSQTRKEVTKIWRKIYGNS